MLLLWFAGVALALCLSLYLHSTLSLLWSDRQIAAKSALWLRDLDSASAGLQLARSSPWHQRRVLVLLNPHSGRGRSRFVYRTLIAPVLSAHACSVELLETTHAAHAKEWISDAGNDLSRFDLLLVLSGDGMVSEVVNALVARAMPRGALPSDGASFASALARALHALPIALLPGGTSNGLVSSLFGPEKDVVDVFRQVMRSRSRSSDIFSIESPCSDSYSLPLVEERSSQRGYKVDMLCFLYGVVADNDNFAERTFRSWPFLLRTTLAPLCAIALNRKYAARVRIKPLAVSREEESQWHYSSLSALPSWRADPAWLVLDDDAWSSFVVLNVAYPASDVMMAPSAKIDDGSVYACVLRGGLSIVSLLRIFLQLSDGSHNANPLCDYYRVGEFVVEPKDSRGNMILSGEAIPVQSVHGRVHAKAACLVY